MKVLALLGLVALLWLTQAIWVPWLELLAAGEVRPLVKRLRSLGAWAYVASVALALAQALVAPLPAFVLTMANSLVFGGKIGFILSWLSLCGAALLCFGLARWLGQAWVEKRLGPQRFSRMNQMLEQQGLLALVWFRLLPFLPFDPLSFAFGLTGISAQRFFLANLVVQLPATLFYTWLAQGLWEQEDYAGWAGVFLGGFSLIWWLWQRKMAQSKEVACPRS